MSISVVMISLTPSLARSTPGMNPHTPPAAAPASIMAGITTIAGVPGGRIGSRTTALAPHAPSRNWPSAPMFHSRIRNANAQANPVRISGVAFTSVSDNTPMSPNAASMMCRYARIGSPPTSARTIAPITSATTTAAIVSAGDSQAGGSPRGSRRTFMPSPPRAHSGHRRRSLRHPSCAGRSPRHPKPWVSRTTRSPGLRT